MNRVSAAIAMTGLLIGARALALDSTGQPAMNKRQLIAQMVGCMRKQMSANNAISYNEAMKTCKAQMNSQIDNSAPRTLVASDAPAKP
ncbi:MAG: hypothetical protein ACLPX1_19900 [Steroidobacteraceae bacterium]